MHRLLKTSGTLILLVLLLLPMPVQAITPIVYDNEHQAMESELAHLRETVTEPGTYNITLRFYNNGEIIEKVITLEITADSAWEENQAPVTTSAFEKNDSDGWYASYGSNSELAWSGFINITIHVMEILILLVLLLPFLLLLFQYIFTSKLIKQVSDIL